MGELHIQPSELDRLTEKRKWWYYYLVIAKMIKEQQLEKEQMDNFNNKGQSVDTMEFPDDFVSFSRNREMVKNLEKQEIGDLE